MIIPCLKPLLSQEYTSPSIPFLVNLSFTFPFFFFFYMLKEPPLSANHVDKVLYNLYMKGIV